MYRHIMHIFTKFSGMLIVCNQIIHFALKKPEMTTNGVKLIWRQYSFLSGTNGALNTSALAAGLNSCI